MTDTAPHFLRINEQLEAYWQRIRKNDAMPLESAVVIEDLVEIWDHCFLVNVRPDKFSYSYLGAALIEAYGDNMTGKEITETLLYPHPISLFSTFKNVVVSGEPRVDDSEFINRNGVTIKYRSCVLPLAAPDRSGIRFLLGGMKWKAYTSSNPKENT